LSLDTLRGMKNRIKELREAAGMSQQQLADKAGLTAPSISRLERDTREMSRTTRKALAKALDVSESELFSEGKTAGQDAAGESDARQSLLALCKTVEQFIELDELNLAALTADKLADRCQATIAATTKDSRGA
jgi:transcriptional regulator with XRE-family HTH domain